MRPARRSATPAGGGGVAGAGVTITRFDLGPDWYPLLVAAVALPGAWLGGAWHRRARGDRRERR